MKRPNHATVIASLALFVALGGSAYAGAQLAKNSVGTKQLKKNAVTAAKIKNGAVTGAKVDESSLGEVPSAASAGHATTAGSATSAGHANTAGSATTAGHANSAGHATTAADAATLGGLARSGFVESGDVLFGSASPTNPAVQTVVAAPGQFRISTVGDAKAEFKFKFENLSSHLWYLMRPSALNAVPAGDSATLDFGSTFLANLMAVDAADESRHVVVDCGYRSTSPPVISCSALLAPAP